MFQYIHRDNMRIWGSGYIHQQKKIRPLALIFNTADFENKETADLWLFFCLWEKVSPAILFIPK